MGCRVRPRATGRASETAAWPSRQVEAGSSDPADPARRRRSDLVSVSSPGGGRVFRPGRSAPETAIRPCVGQLSGWMPGLQTRQIGLGDGDQTLCRSALRVEAGSLDPADPARRRRSDLVSVSSPGGGRVFRPGRSGSGAAITFTPEYRGIRGRGAPGLKTRPPSAGPASILTGEPGSETPLNTDGASAPQITVAMRNVQRYAARKGVPTWLW